MDPNGQPCSLTDRVDKTPVRSRASIALISSAFFENSICPFTLLLLIPPTVRPLRRYDRSDGTTAPAVRPLRRYDRPHGSRGRHHLKISYQKQIQLGGLPTRCV